jgi:hypothetical protein
VLLRRVAVAGAALALAGCGGGHETTTTSSLAPGCEAPAMSSVVRSYFAAISNGDRAALDRSLSPADDFVRLTVEGADGSRFSTADRAKALAYLAGRHAHGERLRLLELAAAQGVDVNHDTVVGTATRTAQDGGRAVVAFDGAVNCVTRSISRWRIRPSGG